MRGKFPMFAASARLLAVLAFFFLASMPGGTAHAQPTPLNGGTLTIDLVDLPTDPPDRLTFVFQNNTGILICDLLLSTNDSDWVDPDFEGDIIVRDAQGNNLNWMEIPVPAHGVEDIKTKAVLVPANCVANGATFSVSILFDEVDDGDILRVTPTCRDGGQIMIAACGQKSRNEFALFNGYAGLPGSTTGVFVSFNNLDADISELQFAAITAGVSISQVTSTLPSTFDVDSGLLSFSMPVGPGEPLDYRFTVDSLAPFVEGDPDPFTRIEVLIPPSPPVGGATEFLVEGSDAPASPAEASGSSSPPYAVLGGAAAAAAVALTAGGWYARRRLS